jgi:hypothetical protein
MENDTFENVRRTNSDVEETFDRNSNKEDRVSYVVNLVTTFLVPISKIPFCHEYFVFWGENHFFTNL